MMQLIAGAPTACSASDTIQVALLSNFSKNHPHAVKNLKPKFYRIQISVQFQSAGIILSKWLNRIVSVLQRWTIELCWNMNQCDIFLTYFFWFFWVEKELKRWKRRAVKSLLTMRKSQSIVQSELHKRWFIIPSIFKYGRKTIYSKCGFFSTFTCQFMIFVREIVMTDWLFRILLYANCSKFAVKCELNGRGF